MIRGAAFSQDKIYRYALWRIWDQDREQVLFIGLNPSTADERQDDPTIRRCIGFASAWGYGGMWITNLFALRTPSPKIIRQAADPVGPENDIWLFSLVESFSRVIACWGNCGGYLQRDKTIAAQFPQIYSLAVTKLGFPAHPLYLPTGIIPTEYRIPAMAD